MGFDNFIKKPSSIVDDEVLSFSGTSGTVVSSGKDKDLIGAAAGGDVVGPASSTDNAIARFDSTTGELLQDSVVTVGDTGAITGVTDITASGTIICDVVRADTLANEAGTGPVALSMGATIADNKILKMLDPTASTVGLAVSTGDTTGFGCGPNAAYPAMLNAGVAKLWIDGTYINCSSSPLPSAVNTYQVGSDTLPWLALYRNVEQIGVATSSTDLDCSGDGSTTGRGAQMRTFTTGGTDKTWTIPAPTTARKGRHYTAVKLDSGIGALIVDATASGLIKGVAFPAGQRTMRSVLQFNTLELVCDGTDWIIVNLIGTWS